MLSVANPHGVELIRSTWNIALHARREGSDEYPAVLKELISLTNWWMEARHDPTRTYELDQEGD
jgi:hypothetical protein